MVHLFNAKYGAIARGGEGVQLAEDGLRETQNSLRCRSMLRHETVNSSTLISIAALDFHIFSSFQNTAHATPLLIYIFLCRSGPRAKVLEVLDAFDGYVIARDICFTVSDIYGDVFDSVFFVSMG